MLYCYLLSNQTAFTPAQEMMLVQNAMNPMFSFANTWNQTPENFMALPLENVPYIFGMPSKPNMFYEQKFGNYCSSETYSGNQNSDLAGKQFCAIQISGSNDIKKKEKKMAPKKGKQTEEPNTAQGRNPGRNSTSNIFRVFLKLCCKSKFETILEQKFQQIAKAKNFFINFQYFKMKVRELSPSTSNYINVKEFKKSCDSDNQFSRAFRMLFHWFLNNYAPSHCLTLKGKHRMMKESISCFLGSLHDIEEELWRQPAKQLVKIEALEFTQ